MKGYLRENPEVAVEIEGKIYEALGAEPAAAPLAAVAADARGRTRRRPGPARRRSQARTAEAA